MQRWIAVVAVLGVVVSGYLGWQNRKLAAEVAALRQREGTTAASSAGLPGAANRDDDGHRWQLGRRDAEPAPAGVSPPSLEGEAKESRLDRRLRRQEQIAQLLGRLPGETDEEYKARVMPLVNIWIDRARKRADEMRAMVEVKANLSPVQKQQIDQAMAPAYDEFIAYTNAAIQDGQLSPYDISVTGMLEYAGGLGPLLSQTERSINEVLSPEQQKIFASSGFEWGEYLWAYAPWDQLTPPPPP